MSARFRRRARLRLDRMQDTYAAAVACLSREGVPVYEALESGLREIADQNQPEEDDEGVIFE